ncbi:MAG: hypothetical protein OXC81_01195 [Betaproteobacteria bacterium]|nr:hypothetical protein [Betaproteobacteria bacterium]
MREFVQAVSAAIEAQGADVEFVIRQIGRMPPLPRLAVAALRGAFQINCLLANGCSFEQLDAAGRTRRLQAWRTSGLAPLRDFVLLHEGLLVFSAYSQLEQTPDP